MKTKAVFYHAGCPVCVSAEQGVASSLDSSRFDLNVVHRVAKVLKDGVEVGVGHPLHIGGELHTVEQGGQRAVCHVLVFTSCG